MTLYLAQDTTSGDVFVTDGTASSDSLHYTEWQGADNQPRGLDLSLFALDFDALTNWPDGYRILAQQ